MSNFDKKKSYIDSFADRVKQIPESNGCRFYKKLDYKIAIISDEFFFNSIKDAANFIYLTKNNWADVLNQGVDAFFFETPWTGIKNEWCGFTWPGSNESKLIFDDIIAVCNRKKIPTIFFSKEDPPDFYTFLPYAKKADYVFSSTVECISEYKKHCKHNNVYATSFCFNPQYNNPIGCDVQHQENRVLFAGAWYEAFPERCVEQARIFDSILDSDKSLVVIDRFYTQEKESTFPSKYLPCIYPGVTHAFLQKLHKIFKWAINVNSIKDSETMFANRTFELLASGTLVISNYSVGVNSLLPYIFVVSDYPSVKNILESYSDRELYERQMAGVRSVMSTETCYQRISEYLSPIGLDAEQPKRKILVVAEKLSHGVRKNFERQTYSDKTLIESSQLTKEILSEFDMVTWFGGVAHYGEFYLEDMINAFKYTNCDYITKDCWCEGSIIHEGVEHNYVNFMRNKERTVFWVEAFDLDALISMRDNCALESGYSIDSLEYNSKPLMDEKSEDKEYKLAVILPTYNNGKFLYSKAFSSLRLCSMFEDMEIIIVDDGSTDGVTLKIQDWLASRYKNVTLYRFNDGGSGSPSRARNKGVEIATAPYLMFLDPDDEAVPSGYDALYKQAVNEELSIVMGTRYLCNGSQSVNDYIRNIVKRTGKHKFPNGAGKYLKELSDLCVGVNGILLKKALFDKYSLKFVEKAIGEDTLFSLQIMSLPESMSVVDVPVYIYHERVANSLTNSIGINFFEKNIKILPYERRFLEEQNIVNVYSEKRVDGFIYYLFSKLVRCAAEDKEAAAKKVFEVIQNYEPEYKTENYIINRYIKFCKSGEYGMAADSVSGLFECKIANFGIRNLSNPASNDAASEAGSGNTVDLELVYLLVNERKIRIKYSIYKILSKFGLRHYSKKKGKNKLLMDRARAIRKQLLAKL